MVLSYITGLIILKRPFSFFETVVADIGSWPEYSNKDIQSEELSSYYLAFIFLDSYLCPLDSQNMNWQS